MCRQVQTRTSSDIIFVTHSYVTNTYKPRRNHKSQLLLNDLGHAENSPVAGFVAVPRHRHDWLWLCQWGPHPSSAAKDDVIGNFRFQQGCLNIGSHESDWFISAFLIQVATLEYHNTNPDVFQLHKRCTLKKHQFGWFSFGQSLNVESFSFIPVVSSEPNHLLFPADFHVSPNLFTFLIGISWKIHYQYLDQLAVSSVEPCATQHLQPPRTCDHWDHW